MTKGTSVPLDLASSIGAEMKKEAEDYIRIGDYISLYCNTHRGYVFSDRSSCRENYLRVYTDQDRKKPTNVSNPMVLRFYVSAQNRYVHNKKLRKLKQQIQDAMGQPSGIDDAELKEAEICARTEQHDNELEQRRLHGKPLLYGDIIQLKHSFSDHWVHIDNTKTSARDKSKIIVHLLPYNGKPAHLKILPKYRVHVEGDHVRNGDQISIESIKSPGQFFDVSQPYPIDGDLMCELNVGVNAAELTIFHRPPLSKEHAGERVLLGGTFVQLRHEDLEAYLCAEGLFTQNPTETVNLQVRPTDYTNPTTLYPPSSCTTYWQLEHEKSVICDDVIEWGHYVRLRHLTTRMFLFVSDEGAGLTADPVNPHTVFRLHPINRSFGAISDGSCCRLEHVLTSTWLGALQSENYIRNTMKWDRSIRKKVGFTSGRVYQDAFRLDAVKPQFVMDYNRLSGLLPFLLAVTKQEIRLDEVGRRREYAMMMNGVIMALGEIEQFVKEEVEAHRNRRRLLREMMVLELLMELMKTLTSWASGDNKKHIYRCIHEIFYTCIENGELSDSIYFIQFLETFLSQLYTTRGHDLLVTRMLIALVSDRKQVIETLNMAHIDSFVTLLIQNEHHRFLQLLGTLCVCDGTAMVTIQNRICERLISDEHHHLFRFGLRHGVVVVIDGSSKTETPIADFIDKSWAGYCDEDCHYLKQQLVLLYRLCQGRNHFCMDHIIQNTLSWDIIVGVLKSEANISDHFRAAFTDLMLVLFIDAGKNTSIYRSSAYSTFEYSQLSPHTDKDMWYHRNIIHVDPVLQQRIETFKPWILEFLENNTEMVASNTQRNAFINSVIRVVCHLVEYGYLVPSEMMRLHNIFMDLLDGTTDLPFAVHHTTTRFFSSPIRCIEEYRRVDRFLKSEETDIIVAAKCQAMEFLGYSQDVMMNFIGEQICAKFKEVNEGTESGFLYRLESPMFNVLEKMTCRSLFKSPTRVRYLVNHLIKIVFSSKSDTTISVLKDLTRYEYDFMTSHSLILIHNLLNIKPELVNLLKNSQLLLTPASTKMYRDIRTYMPQLRRLLNVQLTPDQYSTISHILDAFKDCCRLPFDMSRPHALGQNILRNEGLIPLLVSIVNRSHASSQEKNECTDQTDLCRDSLQLLRLTAKENLKVQTQIFSHIEDLLRVKTCPRELANALLEVFRYNADMSWRIKPAHVRSVVSMIGSHQERAPELISLLRSFIIADEQGTLIKRNQALVIRFFLEGYPRDAHIFEYNADRRRAILQGKEGKDMLEYFLHIMDLLVVLLQESKGVIQSFSQNALTIWELFDLLSLADVPAFRKISFINYLVSCFLKKDVLDLDRKVSLMHNNALWEYMEQLCEDVDWCITQLSGRQLSSCFMMTQKQLQAADPDDEESTAAGILLYFIDGACNFIKRFCQLYTKDEDGEPEETRIMRRLAGGMKRLFPLAAPVLTRKRQVVTLEQTMDFLMRANAESPDEIKITRGEMQQVMPAIEESPNAVSEDDQLHKEELELNEQFQVFVRQIEEALILMTDKKPQKGKSAIGRAKDDLAGDKGFRSFIRVFIDDSRSKDVAEKYQPLVVIIDHLRRSSVRERVGKSTKQDERVDTYCLHILKFILETKIRDLPTNWKNRRQRKSSRLLSEIHEIQNFFVDHGLVDALQLMMMRLEDKDIQQEVLALYGALLFGANPYVQDSTVEHFSNTKEEVFVLILRGIFEQWTQLAKERKSIDAQRKRKSHVEDRPDPMNIQQDDSRLDAVEKVRKESDTDADMLLTSTDDDLLDLVMRMLGALCDGKHTKLQNYLRWQPDNLRTFNLVAGTAALLRSLFTSLTDKTYHLVLQVIGTLNEITVGNPENRLVLLDNKLIDNINRVFRVKRFPGITEFELLTLLGHIADLLISMIEEGCSGSVDIPKEVATTLDLVATRRVLVRCHAIATTSWWKTSWLNFGRQNKVHPAEQSRFTDKQQQKVKDIGKNLYRVIIALSETGSEQPPGVDQPQSSIPETQVALAYFGRFISTIEILKDDVVHKVYFKVPENSAIREEMKEKVKWEVDRSTAGSKLRDFLDWSQLIISDIQYNRKVLSDPIASFIASYWLLWNYLVILLSILINIIMLAVWKAPKAAESVLIEDGMHPPYVESIYADTQTLPEYDTLIYALGAAHNLLSFILVTSFILSNNPGFPRMIWLRRIFWKFMRNFGMFTKREERDKFETASDDKGRITFFSFSFIYYQVFLVASVAGTFTQGYLFAFHLLNIANVNQLLRHVLKAFTMNLRSLMWVAVFGVVILYIYTLLGFAFFRASFMPENNLYCSTLYECAVSVLRYGLIGDISEVIQLTPEFNTFETFAGLAVYQITFFIIFTTILLNIIFGIIVDTFSELRDLKWRAEKDMQEVCFICSRQSYDFEHHAKGFQHHVKNDHSMWSYLYYFLHLNETDPNDYTALDSYVSKLLAEGRHDFFPLNRALCFSNYEEDCRETKLDSMADRVEYLLNLEQNKISTKSRKRAEHQRKMWKSEHLEMQSDYPSNSGSSTQPPPSPVSKQQAATVTKAERVPASKQRVQSVEAVGDPPQLHSPDSNDGQATIMTTNSVDAPPVQSGFLSPQNAEANETTAVDDGPDHPADLEVEAVLRSPAELGMPTEAETTQPVPTDAPSSPIAPDPTPLTGAPSGVPSLAPDQEEPTDTSSQLTTESGLLPKELSSDRSAEQTRKRSRRKEHSKRHNDPEYSERRRKHKHKHRSRSKESSEPVSSQLSPEGDSGRT